MSTYNTYISVTYIYSRVINFFQKSWVIQCGLREEIRQYSFFVGASPEIILFLRP